MKFHYNYPIRNISLLTWLIISTLACNQTTKQTAITGRETLYADSSTIEIVESLKDVYTSIYTQANLEIKYGNKLDVLKMLVKDSCRSVILNQALDSSLINFFKKQKLSPRSICLAEDAIVFGVHKNYKDTAISIKDLKSHLQNDDKTNHTSVKIIALKSSLSMIENVSKILNIPPSQIKVKTFNTHIELAQHLNNSPQDIALFSMSWLNSPYNTRIIEIFKDIKILSIIDANNKVKIPSQESLMDKQYQFTQSIFLNMKGNFSGIGSGFATFCLSERGQMIILKSGLRPMVLPSRTVELKNNLQ